MAAVPKQAISPLERYKAKRNFDVTNEPSAGGISDTGRSFVIQKHWAKALHYDLRLELDGTLKSWAVPKGPSLDPKHKRMAIAVEDHPIAYASFEGTIPDQQYGAGKVIIWDRGTWQPLGDARLALGAGSMKFRLHGEKLHGLWALVRMKTHDEKREAWLLIKERDDAARDASEFSVVDELPDSVNASSVTAAEAPRAAAIGVKASLPEALAPQLATRVDQAPTGHTHWRYEIKFDGYRLLARVHAGTVKLFTRNNNDWTAKLRHLANVMTDAHYPDGWYDGEIVALNDQGVPDFGALQHAFDTAAVSDIVFYLFDLPYCDGYDLRATPLQDRRMLLKKIMAVTPSDLLRFSDTFQGDVHDVLAAACKLGLEGVVGKRQSSRYVSQRSADWIKLKCGERQEFVVGGFTDPLGGRSGFGALLLGVHHDDGALHYVGKVGSGFSDAALLEISKTLKSLRIDAQPFVAVPPAQRRAHWVRPAMLVEVSFSAWTEDGHLRHPVFRGVRQDRQASMIKRESAVHVQNQRASATSAAPPTLAVTHGERVLDQSSGVTKLELVRYYALVGSLMMPHLKQRPVSLLRAPAGFAGELFFQKHVAHNLPTGLKALDPALDPGHEPLVTVASAAGLIAAAQWNVVEFHTSNALATHMDRPDRLIFDLDPGAGVTWLQVQQGSELLHAFLTELRLVSFAKTSGGKGIHVVVPIRRRYEWALVKDFAHAIVTHLTRVLPTHFVDKSGPKNRVGKIFIDYLRNGRGATTVSAWSARARPGAGVSVPLRWEELHRLKSADQWTVRNIHERLDEGNAPWADYEKATNSLTQAMRIMQYRPSAQTKSRTSKS